MSWLLSSNHYKTNLFIAFLQNFDPGAAGESDDSDDDGKILSSPFLYKLYIACKTVDILQYRHWFPHEMTTAEILYWWCVTTQICVVLLIGWNNFSGQWHVISMAEFLRLFLRHDFTGKPVVASWNIGYFCALNFNNLNLFLVKANQVYFEFPSFADLPDLESWKEKNSSLYRKNPIEPIKEVSSSPAVQLVVIFLTLLLMVMHAVFCFVVVLHV